MLIVFSLSLSLSLSLSHPMHDDASRLCNKHPRTSFSIRDSPDSTQHNASLSLPYKYSSIVPSLSTTSLSTRQGPTMAHFTALKRFSAAAAAAATSTLPTSTSRHRGVRHRHRFSNLQITILCGIITVLVLRGSIGIHQLPTTTAAEAEDHRRIVAEIKFKDDPDEENPEPTRNPNSTYTLGPQITNWDNDRRIWLARNPNFPNYLNGKARILLVTGSPPNPCDDPIGDHYLLKSVKNKIDYGRIHGIEIVYNLAHLDSELSGYWAKLPLIRRLMLTHPEIEWIWWMDSDALFTDMVFEIPTLKYANHNLIVHGYPDLLFNDNSWIALNTGSFLLRNCQWSLDLLDAWAPMGLKGPVRNEFGKILSARLKDRPEFESDDQSALIYLLISRKDQWMDKVFLENCYYLHGYWAGLVDRYEEMMEKYNPGLGDERWPFVTHFVGCKPCGGYGDYPVETCFTSMERAFNFADNQVLKLYGFGHRGLLSPKVKRVRNETARPLDSVDQFDIRHSSFGGGGSRTL